VIISAPFSNKINFYSVLIWAGKLFLVSFKTANSLKYFFRFTMHHNGCVYVLLPIAYNG